MPGNPGGPYPGTPIVVNLILKGRFSSILTLGWFLFLIRVLKKDTVLYLALKGGVSKNLMLAMAMAYP